MPTYAGLLKWLLKQKAKDADHVACGIEKPAYAKAFCDKFAALTGIAQGQLFIKATYAMHEALHKQAFQSS